MKKYTLKKERDFVQIPNSIFHEKELSFKAMGLLAYMLSMPESWDFSIEGIVKCTKDSREYVRSGIKELENAGYLVRTRIRGEDGRIIRMEYEVYEVPGVKTDEHIEANQEKDKPTKEKPLSENHTIDIPSEEITPQKRKEINKTKNINNILNITSNHIQSYHDDSEMPKRVSLTVSLDQVAKYRELIRENIDYDILTDRNPLDKELIDEIVELMAETVCLTRKDITISGNTYPLELVKGKFLKINSEHMEYILECLKKNTTDVKNIKQYLLATIFNAPNTIDYYYTSRVQHDMYG